MLWRKDAGEGGTFLTACEGRLCREVFISNGGTRAAWHQLLAHLCIVNTLRESLVSSHSPLVCFLLSPHGETEGSDGISACGMLIRKMNIVKLLTRGFKHLEKSEVFWHEGNKIIKCPLLEMAYPSEK